MREERRRLCKRESSACSRRSSGTASFKQRCSLLVKEQRARFYILRRCVVMLLPGIRKEQTDIYVICDVSVIVNRQEESLEKQARNRTVQQPSRPPQRKGTE
ncbi:unnamed protein product [Citrullus colocynthis]|uniref:Uncharacterized protein n=1 Tax=Citrullus colocynthis TaxID=252529 RepID=A0ABP0Y1G5_9ROSI